MGNRQKISSHLEEAENQKNAGPLGVVGLVLVSGEPHHRAEAFRKKRPGGGGTREVTRSLELKHAFLRLVEYILRKTLVGSWWKT